MDEIGYWLELLHTPSIGPRRYQALLDHIDHPRDLFDGHHDDILQKIPERARNYLRNPNWQLTEKALHWAESPSHHIIPINSHLYPERLKQIADPPPLIFVQGDLQVLQEPQLAVVGSRNPTPAGRKNAYDFSYKMTNAGMTITSGLAMGVDSHAHHGALATQGQTIAVTGTGLDIIYPRSNLRLAEQIVNQGAIISEFTLGTRPSPSNFPRRNRIISGLSLGVLVVEAGLASGSLISARLAMEQGREVFAIPGSIHNPQSKGCHQLLRDGAKLVETIQDILQEFTGQLMDYLPTSSPVESSHFDISKLSNELQQLLLNIGDDPVSVDELITRCGLTAEQISSMLVQLEVNNLVTSYAGRYCRHT